MKMQDIFIGRPIYWVLAGVVVAIMAALGLHQFHVRNFVLFQFTVLGLAFMVVTIIVLSYRPGERLMREPLNEKEEL